MPSAAAVPPEAAGAFILHLDGFDGPMDLLLDLARGQKVDLARISILSLVDQYLAIIEDAQRIRLELAADWLVMAAWLAWLKSRLLLPPGPDDAEEAEDAAGMLAARLDALEHVQRAARWLAARPQLGLEVFARGAPEALVRFDRSGLAADLAGLMRAYLAAARRATSQHGWSPRRIPLWTVADAMARLERMLGGTRLWTQLDLFLPDAPPHVAQDAGSAQVQHRAAIASTLIAGLELARGGVATLRQDAPFAPIMIRRL